MAISSVTPLGTLSPGVTAPSPPWGRSFGSLLQEGVASHVASTQSAKAISTALDLAKGIEQARHRIDTMLEAARAGRAFTPAELISLQAQTYRYTQSVEIVSKLFEQGTQTMKQIVNTPV